LTGLDMHGFTADGCKPVLRCTTGWPYIIIPQCAATTAD